MASTAPALPTRFPCWCRATYSWGGETKRDLGFVEGDLIECLNAGDGSWWTGRLRRDKRAVGLFPSNFVRVLDEGFQPVSRGSSPMTGTNTPTVPPQKSKTFRKPFQAYTKTGYSNPKATASNAVAASAEASQAPSRQSSFIQASSPTPSRQLSFIQASNTPSRQSSYLQTSSTPTNHHTHSSSKRPSHLQTSAQHVLSGRGSALGSRTVSPIPSRQSFQDPEDDPKSSPPPPPPPPHRIAYNATPRRDSPSPTPSMNDRYPIVSRPHTPVTQSPAVPGFTPSPLRDAMDDVMSSLQNMEMGRNVSPPSPEHGQAPLDPWSPEAFEEFRNNSKSRGKRRPRSSLGIASSQRDFGHDEDEDEGFPGPEHDNGRPQVPDYDEHMDTRLRRAGAASPRPPDELFLPDDDNMPPPPAPPPKNSPYQPRPQSSLDITGSVTSSVSSSRRIRNRKSAYELGRSMLDRTFSIKSNTTHSSSEIQSVASHNTTSTQKTSQSLMSGHSAGGFSATSAGSLARRKWGSISRSRPQSVLDTQQGAVLGLNGGGSFARPQTPSQSSHEQTIPASGAIVDYTNNGAESGLLGGLTTPRPRKSGFFKKLVESAKTGAASARSTISAGQMEPPRSPIKNLLPNGVTSIAGGSAARDMGLGGSKSDIDWVQVRRDVNRSNSLSQNEKTERIERCQMMDYPVIAPLDALFENAEGDEGIDGMPVEQPLDFLSVNLGLVDKSARFINSLPPLTHAVSLAQGYVCRPYKSDVQRLRAIFTWVSEKVAWEEDFEGDVDTRRVIQMRRGCSEEVAVLVSEMCSAVGVHSELVRGYLKSPGEVVENPRPRPNHWWNAVVVDGCWRIMDCALASPTNPKRSCYSSAGSQVAENGFFLARPMEICYTHVPYNFEQQHICPPISPEILLALPCACPPYFKHGLQLIEYDTSLFRIENLELVQIQFMVPPDVECVAEVEARSYARDTDGDVFESGDTTKTRALAQAEWVGGQKRYTVKAHLPSDEGHGTLNIYAGKRGLMHSVKDNPHPLAFALPILHTGNNPPYQFLLRHPTPHAQRHDLYVSQPQCSRLAINNTFVFAIRQHPSSSFTACLSPTSDRAPSPSPFGRPSSAMSILSSSATGSDYFSQPFSSTSSASSMSTSSTPSSLQQQQQAAKQDKPAKLAIQSPSGKILRLIRKGDNCLSGEEAAGGGVWETVIKVGERGVWRGLVLADRSARWCVFGEWECI